MRIYRFACIPQNIYCTDRLAHLLITLEAWCIDTEPLLALDVGETYLFHIDKHVATIERLK